MNAKQATRKPGLPIICALSCFVLAMLAATALYLGTGAGSAVRGQTSRPSRRANILPVSANLAGVPTNPMSQQVRKTNGPSLNAFDHLPLAFDANQGQTDAQVKYTARGRGYTLFLTANKAVLAMSVPSESPIKDALFRRSMGLTRWAEVKLERERAANTKVASLDMEMVGANPNPRVVAQDRLPGVSNYFIGNDPSKWRTGVPEYARIAYERVYPGVDLAFHGQQRQMEFDFLVAPGADPSPIALQFTGAKSVALNDSGNVVLTSAAGDLTMNKPVAFQETNGVRQTVDVRFIVKSNQVSLALGSYDHNRELVIDPTLNYATYLGGSGLDEGLGLAIDSNANSYVTGDTNSSNFPSAGGATNGGSLDIFVTKIKADGSAIVYTTLVGGSETDSGFAIAVDSSGNAFVAGDTTSTDFPVTGNAAQSTYGGGATDGVVFELNSSGSRVYSTYLGGNAADDAFAITLDSASNAYVGGETGSPANTLPAGTVNGSLNLGDNTFPGAFDGFVAKINTATTGAMAYFTYVGGSNDDLVSGIALDAPANIVVTGSTISTDFPVTAGAVQATCGTDQNCNTSGGVAQSDAFLTKIGSGNGALPPVASTYLGGSSSDGGVAVAADSSGNAYITGFTFSGDFPTQNPFQTQNLTPSGSFTVFVTKVNSTATALTFSSYLGGSNAEVGNSIVIDQQTPPNLYLTGTTLSTDFPQVDPFQSYGGGNSDAFVSEVDGSGASLIYSSFFGGSGDENFENPAAVGGSIAVVTATVGTITTGTAYLSGITNSPSGLAKNALQSTFAGSGTCGTAPNTFPCTDAFLAQVSAASGTTSPDFSVNITPTSATVSAGQTTSSIGVTVTSLSNFTGTVTLACTSLPAQSKCNFGSTSLPVAPGTGGATTVTISTTAPSSAQLTHGRSGFTYALWLPLAGVALFGAGFPVRRKKFLLVLGCLLLAAIMALPGCSSSSSGGGGGGGGGGTPGGNYTIGVTGTSGTTTHTASFFLTVQ